MSDSVWISLISAASAIVVAFITVKYKNQTPKQKSRNRVDMAFDMYEGLIKQLNSEIARKDEQIARLAAERDQLANKERE